MWISFPCKGVMVKMQGSLPHGCIQQKEVLCLGTLATDLGAKLLERNSYNRTSSHARARQICKPILFECVPRSGKDHNFVIIGVPKESYPGESRVALVPAVLPNLLKAGFEVVIETEAGSEAGYPDRFYSEKGAKVRSEEHTSELQSRLHLVCRLLLEKKKKKKEEHSK